MAGYQKLEVLIREELDELVEEGREINKDECIKKINDCKGDIAKLNALYDEFVSSPYRSDFGYSEPSEYDEILDESSPVSDADVGKIPFSKYHGAWLGRCVGCALGQPVELWTSQSIAEWYKNAGKYPINGYVPTHSGGKTNNGIATDENIKGMPMDDDIRFTVLGYKLLQSKGYDFDTYDVGAHWMYNLPYRYICTAENQAYLNFASVDSFGPWGRPENAMETLKASKVNFYRNPYREWIGAQIRIDAYAYCAAGRPAKAAKAAFSDAYLSHQKNGIYSAMFFAALIASAFNTDTIDGCFEKALSFVPKRSRFYASMLKAKEIGLSAKSREEMSDRIENEMQKYDFVHAINNSAVCVASIFRSRGDFAEAVCSALHCGMDTDCNCATVGSFMGAFVGAENIPDFFASPLCDTYSSGITGYDNASIKDFAMKCKEISEKI